MALHQVEGFSDPRVRGFNAGHRCMRVRQQDKGEAVAMVGAIRNALAVQQPGVAACRRVSMTFAQILRAMLRSALVGRVTKLPVRHRVVENEARAADEVARLSVIHGAVVAKKMKESAARIDGAWMIERHRVADVIEQNFAAAEIWHALYCSVARTV